MKLEAIERRPHSEVLYEIEFQAEDFKSLIGENIYTSKLCSLYHKTETATPYQGEISIWFKNGVGKLTLYIINVSNFSMKIDLEYGSGTSKQELHKSYKSSKL